MSCNLGSALSSRERNKLDELCEREKLIIEYNTERLFQGEFIVKVYYKRNRAVILNKRYIDTIPTDEDIYWEIVSFFRHEKLDKLL
jgi:hypothetical protein